MLYRKNNKKGLQDVTNRGKCEKKVEPMLKQAILSDREKHVLKKHMTAEKREIISVANYAHEIDKFYEEIDTKGKLFHNHDFVQRTSILDWVVGIQTKLNLTDDTLHFCIQLLDLFLSKNKIGNEKLHLAGTAAILISSKYEEVEWPNIRSILRVGKINIAEEEVKKAERCMLYNTNYDILFVNPLYFLRRASKANGYEETSRNMAKYFLELITLSKNCHIFSAKVKSSASMYLSRKICKQDKNKNLFLKYSNIEQRDIKDCMLTLIKLICDPPISEELENKYSTKARFHVSSIARNFAKETFSAKEL